MAEIIKMVKLQSNTRGSWRDVLEFDASNDYLTSQIMYAAALLFDNVPGATLRIIIPTNTAPLMNWTPADGWKLLRAA